MWLRPCDGTGNHERVNGSRPSATSSSERQVINYNTDRKRKCARLGSARRRARSGTSSSSSIKNNTNNNINNNDDSSTGNKSGQHAPLAAPARPATISNLNRLISIIVAGLVIVVAHSPVNHCARTSIPMVGSNRKPRALYDVDLMEGRLDTSQLCGTRFPVGPFKQLKLDDSNHRPPARLPQQDGGDGGGAGELHRHWPQQQQQQQQERAGASANNLLYIVGGDEVDDGQFWPWSVAIYELDPLNGRRAFICSGSLISDKFILTAAHCIQQSRFDILSPDEVSLKIASTRLDDDRNHFYQVERIFVHPEYTVDRKTNDIALLELKHGQRLPLRARPICLPSNVANRVDFTDQQVTIIGWGKTSAMQGNEPSRLIDLANGAAGPSATHQKRPPAFPPPPAAASSGLLNDDERLMSGANERQLNDTLLQAEVRVTSTDQCNRNYSKLEISWLNIDEHFLCASDPAGKRDACQGDSGGPLMWNNQQGLMSGADELEASEGGQEKWYQLGLVSFGYGCANQEYPGVYTRISYYMPWILRVVKSARMGDLTSASD